MSFPTSKLPPGINSINLGANPSPLSTLASHYMNLFDFPQVSKGLNGKRTHQTLENIFHAQPTKKNHQDLFTQGPSMTSPAFHNPLLPNYMLQNMQMLKLQAQAFGPGFPDFHGFSPNLAENFGNILEKKVSLCEALKKNTEKNAQIMQVKEEYIKHEDVTFPQAIPARLKLQIVTTNDTSESASKPSPKAKPFKTKKRTMNVCAEFNPDEPSLFELTTTYPEWDLVTIVHYLRTGKMKEPSKAKRRAPKEDKESSEIESEDDSAEKTLKKKLKKDSDFDYKPYRT